METHGGGADEHVLQGRLTEGAEHAEDFVPVRATSKVGHVAGRHSTTKHSAASDGISRHMMRAYG